ALVHRLGGPPGAWREGHRLQVPAEGATARQEGSPAGAERAADLRHHAQRQERGQVRREGGYRGQGRASATRGGGGGTSGEGRGARGEARGSVEDSREEGGGLDIRIEDRRPEAGRRHGKGRGEVGREGDRQSRAEGQGRH